jgi:hemoglobin
MSWTNVTTPYEQLGGEAMIDKLVQTFYPKVLQDPDLSPLFIEGIEGIMKKQTMFLTQFLGGPPLYSEVYGPPAMRQRHLPFPVTPQRANAWLRCMKESMDEVGLEGPIRDAFFDRLAQVAAIMVNTQEHV